MFFVNDDRHACFSGKKNMFTNTQLTANMYYVYYLHIARLQCAAAATAAAAAAPDGHRRFSAMNIKRKLVNHQCSGICVLPRAIDYYTNDYRRRLSARFHKYMWRPSVCVYCFT